MGWKRDLGYIDLNKNGEPKKKKTKPAINPLLDFWIFFGGVVLPAAALCIEATSHVCAHTFFDPLPSAAHTVLWAMVPIANFLAWLSIHRDMSQHYGVTLFANGMAVGIAILYSLMFLPLTPILAIGVLFFGLGLLGLSPLLSLLPLWAGANHVGKLSKQDGSRFHPEQAKNLGHIIILVAVLAVELPSTLTRIAISMTNESETRQKGIDILRTFGSQDVMLRACYERSGRATDILGSLAEAAHPTNVDVVRSLFYKVTGRTFNSFPIPESARATMQHVGFLNSDYMDAQVDDEFDLDPDMAGEMVSGVSRGLTASKSNMNAQIDADAGVAQLDWFLNFANKSKYDREVRTRIKLPTGGAVNQASLIVDGKEYECQIMVKQAARAVYQAAVKQKKNPLLVSVCGQDTVLVQCYPVPPGLDIKLHLGVVAPLTLDKNEQAVLNLPQFEERNFQVNVAHSLSLVSNHEIKSKWGQSKKEKDQFVLSGEIDGASLATGGGVISLSRDTNYKHGSTIAWAKDSFKPGDFVVLESLQKSELAVPKTLSVVIDGSISMKDTLSQVTKALRKIPKNVSVSISFVSDTGLKKLCTALPSTDPKFQSVLQELEAQQCIGGQMDGQALLEATTEATEHIYLKEQKPDGAVLWIHPSQPVKDGASGQIKQRLAYWRLKYPLLYDMQIASGPNQYIDGINNYSIAKVERFGNAKEDLELLFDQWATPGLLKKFNYERWPLAPIGTHISNAPHFTQMPHPGAVRPVMESAASAPVASAEVVNASITDAAAGSIAGAAAPAVYTTENFEPQTYAAVPAGNSSMKQLAQLWAYDRIIKDLRSRKRGKRREALKLAGAYHLVTPLSSGILADTVPALDASSRPAEAIDSASNSPLAFLNRKSLHTMHKLEDVAPANNEVSKHQYRAESRRIYEESLRQEAVPSRAIPVAPAPTPVPMEMAMPEAKMQGSAIPVPAPSSAAPAPPSLQASKPSSFPMTAGAPAGGGGSPAGVSGSLASESISNAKILSDDNASADSSAAIESKKEVAERANIAGSFVRRADGSIEDFSSVAKQKAADAEDMSDDEIAMDELASSNSESEPSATAPKSVPGMPAGLNVFQPAPMVPESDSIWLSLAAGVLLFVGIMKKRFSRKSA